MTFHEMLLLNHSIYQKKLMEYLAGTGLSTGQPKILDYLRDHNGQSQREIACGCYIEAASLTSLLNGMEGKGLIERKRLNGNRRTNYIFLTEKGKEKLSQVEDAFRRIEEETFKGLSQEEREGFISAYKMICDTLILDNKGD